MIGTSMVIGDGVLTPAISVLSAVVGIQQAKESHISNACMVGISTMILLLLFMLQRFGTSKVAFLFSPIMLLWFTFTPIIGVYNIVKYYPKVFKALSPHYIILFFQKNKVHGWEALSGIILVMTGAEAMFADLGHFNNRAIQVAFSCFVYPSLILTYLGQTAFLIHDPSKLGSTFFASIPNSVYWPMFVVSTLAAIVASQALISATFSIVKQAVALGSFPRVKITHTSEEEVGQVYSPAANYILMVLCLVVVLRFQNGTQIGNAYGVAVIFVMAITTCLVSLVMLLVWETTWPLILLFFVTFMAIEGTYVTAVMHKIPQGGWVPFIIAFVLLFVMLTWYMGRQAKQSYEAQNKMSLDSLLELLTSPNLQRVPGICFFFSDLYDGPPPVFTHYVKNIRSLHRTLVFTTLRFVPVKTVLPSERFLVGRMGLKGVYKCIARYGYKDLVNVHEEGFMQQVIASLSKYLEEKLVAEENGECADAPSQLFKVTPEEILILQDEINNGEVYIIEKAKVHLTKEAGWLHRFVVNKFFNLLQTNCRSTIADLEIPAPNLLEVGMVYRFKGD